MAKHQLITLSSPIAIRQGDATKLVSIVEATEFQVAAGVLILTIHAAYLSGIEQFAALTPPVRVEIKASNIRSKQEVPAK